MLYIALVHKIVLNEEEKKARENNSSAIKSSIIDFGEKKFCEILKIGFLGDSMLYCNDSFNFIYMLSTKCMVLKENLLENNVFVTFTKLLLFNNNSLELYNYNNQVIQINLLFFSIVHFINN